MPRRSYKKTSEILDTTWSFRVRSDFKAEFLRKFPRGVPQIFVLKALQRALNDRKFFEEIYFS